MSVRRPAGVTHSDTFVPLGAATFYVPTGWHHEQRCRSCGVIVDYRDEQVHRDSHTELSALRAEVTALRELVVELSGGVEPGEGQGADELVRRANEYGEAAGYPGRGAAQFWGEGMRQVGGLIAADWRWLRGRFRSRDAIVSP